MAGKRVSGNFVFEDFMAPDPHGAELHAAMWIARYQFESLTQAQALRLLGTADAYCHFAGHVAPNKIIEAQLRKLRAAASASRSPEEP